MKLIEHFLTNNPCYLEGRKINVKGVMLHSVGYPASDCARFLKSWNEPSFNRACVHCFIDAHTGIVYQTLPWNHRAWHCGFGPNGSANNTHISIEMCEPLCIEYSSSHPDFFTSSDPEVSTASAERTYRAAVELTAMLCKRYHLDPQEDGVVISHKEGHQRGIASDHKDPEHIWTCLNMGYTMDTFRRDVEEKMNMVIDHPTVALTFDDGPSPETTPKILDLLSEYDAKATFCVLGSLVRLYPDIVKRAVSSGCEIVNHTWNHERLTQLTDEEVLSNIQASDLAISEASGVHPFLIRPPYAAYNKHLLKLMKKSGKAGLFWYNDSLDWKLRDAQQIIPHVLDSVKDRDIILMHDLYPSTYEAAAVIIPELIKRGFELKTVSGMLEEKNIPLISGQRYRHG